MSLLGRAKKKSTGGEVDPPDFLLASMAKAVLTEGADRLARAAVGRRYRYAWGK